MDVRDIFYHGIITQVRRVIDALGPERTDAGLTAFEDGASNWSECFFARALAPRVLHSELDVANALGFHSKSTKHGYNLVPIRIIWHTFDSLPAVFTREQLLKLIMDIRDESRPKELMDFLKSIDYKGVDEKELVFSGASCVR